MYNPFHQFQNQNSMYHPFHQQIANNQQLPNHSHKTYTVCPQYDNTKQYRTCPYNTYLYHTNYQINRSYKPVYNTHVNKQNSIYKTTYQESYQNRMINTFEKN